MHACLSSCFFGVVSYSQSSIETRQNFANTTVYGIIITQWCGYLLDNIQEKVDSARISRITDSLSMETWRDIT